MVVPAVAFPNLVRAKVPIVPRGVALDVAVFAMKIVEAALAVVRRVAVPPIEALRLCGPAMHIVSVL